MIIIRVDDENPWFSLVFNLVLMNFDSNFPGSNGLNLEIKVKIIQMKYDIFGLGEARAISDILQSCFTQKALLLANHLFPTIFESVDEHHFLKI